MKFNQKQLERMARQMGMNMEQIDAEEVVIKKSDGSRIVITSPSVSRINMMGQDTFQVTGAIAESESAESEEDVELVVEQTGASAEDARAALREAGDLAGAIIKLKKK
jgi:nascent polypeptide-associated complex subunit alpha